MRKNNTYHEFTALDFINDESFQDWAISGNEENNRFWNNFLSDNPEKREQVSIAKSILEAIRFKESYPTNEKVQQYLKATFESIDNNNKNKSPKAIVRSINRGWWIAAASFLLIASIGYYFLRPEKTNQIVKNATPAVFNDVAPGGNKAVLTLASGETIILDSVNNGILSEQGNATVTKLADGRLSYDAEKDGATKEIVYNTISVPKGGQYNLTLSDGSRVWLNAESSLRFPASFAGDERNVALTGEGYFEIARNKQKPFHVSVSNTIVEVLGTHFNIKAYKDEKNLKTTLLEGSVKVIKGNQVVILDPGQQAVVNNSSNNIIINNSVNLEEVVAWKNGLFQFDNTDIKDVMRRIGRWYDLEVVLKGNFEAVHISGKVERNLTFLQMVKVLEESGIEIQLEGKKITATARP